MPGEPGAFPPPLPPTGGRLDASHLFIAERRFHKLSHIAAAADGDEEVAAGMKAMAVFMQNVRTRGVRNEVELNVAIEIVATVLGGYDGVQTPCGGSLG
jgi:hypothetical protein